MERIVKSLQNSAIIDSSSINTKALSKNPMKTFSLYNVIHHGKASVNDIAQWQYRISDLIYAMHAKRIFTTREVDIKKVVVHPDKQLVDTQIVTKVDYNFDSLSEVHLMNTMIKLHTSMISAVDESKCTSEESTKLGIFSIIGSHMYSVAASHESKKLNLFQFVLFYEHIWKCVETGMIDDLYTFISSRTGT